MLLKSVWFCVSVFSALPTGLRRVRNFEFRFPNWFWNVYFFENNDRRCHWMRLRWAKFPAKMKKKLIFLRVFSFSICSQIDAWSFGIFKLIYGICTAKKIWLRSKIYDFLTVCFPFIFWSNWTDPWFNQ